MEHSDTAMSGNRMPMSVTHYYNSHPSDKNSCNCDFGWKIDTHQKMTTRTRNSNNYCVWENGNGTEHYFLTSGSQS